jgi:iron complex outermembrane recepter protein
MKACMKAAMAVWLSNMAMSFAMTEYAEAAPVADDSNTLDELVVTAQKRVSTVQDTPISISAVSGDDLLARGVSSRSALHSAMLPAASSTIHSFESRRAFLIAGSC